LRLLRKWVRTPFPAEQNGPSLLSFLPSTLACSEAHPAIFEAALTFVIVGGRIGTLARMRTPKPKEWTSSEMRKLFKMAKQGARASKIAAELGRYAGSVKRMARSVGLLLKK
jgi:hypothetical protein